MRWARLKNVASWAMRMNAQPRAREGRDATSVCDAFTICPPCRSETRGQAAAGNAGPCRGVRYAGWEPPQGCSMRWIQLVNIRLQSTSRSLEQVRLFGEAGDDLPDARLYAG